MGRLLDPFRRYRGLVRIGRSHVERSLRAWPIRWRILLIALVNAAVVVTLSVLVWTGANILTGAWADLGRVRQSDWALASLESEAGRLQNLLQRYFSRPDPAIMDEIAQRREALARNFAAHAAAEPVLTDALAEFSRITDRALANFEGLRTAQAATVRIFETEITKPARDMAGLYAIIDGAARTPGNLIWPSLGKSREAFSTILVAVNAYYLSPDSDASDEARRNIALIERTIPVMLDLADSELQRGALAKLQARIGTLRGGLDDLARAFATQKHLLQDLVDGNARGLSRAIDELSRRLHDRETRTHARFDQELDATYTRIFIVATLSLLVVVVVGMLVARTISGPLSDLGREMQAIISGEYHRDVSGLQAGDEVGAMARALSIFKANAVARLLVEAELRSAKERAETALGTLKETQASLVEAEKLAALGALVAGVAHEVNTPVGISLTIASSLADRMALFAKDYASGTLRRARIADFLDNGQDGCKQLIVNLERAGELVQSFKQVAVDRSQSDRRPFNLKEATDQVMSSLRLSVKQRHIQLDVSIPDDIVLLSYPGAYGQVLTNLFVNATTHAFPDGRNGRVTIVARRLDAHHIELVFSDDGQGMNGEVRRRAFDPFFTTRRGHGGTGLGLHIVYNIVTRQLGGRVTIDARVTKGTCFEIVLPLTAGGDAALPPHDEPLELRSA